MGRMNLSQSPERILTARAIQVDNTKSTLPADFLSPLRSLVSIAFTEESETTRVTLRHIGLASDEVKEKHTMGWTGSLEQLGGFLS